MTLREQIDNAKRSVSTDELAISIGEIGSMYEAKELHILPEFQRLFRWGPQKKSDFIESLLVGIPIPPAFAYEREDATWELIDGLQRISTVLEFQGLLRDPDNPDKLCDPTTLVGAKYLPGLDGVGWVHGGADGKGIGKELQLFIRRARIDFQILKYPSDATTKFDLFQRLNRGGAYANAQEVRTCAMVLANEEATRKIREIAKSEPFRTVFRVNEDQSKIQKDVEYAVRLLAHASKAYEGKLDVEEFLDKAIIELLQEDNWNAFLDDAVWSVETLHAIDGDKVLLPPKNIEFKTVERFALRSLEVIAVGVLINASAIKALPKPEEFVRERITKFWMQTSALEGMSGAGQRGTTRWGKTLPFGMDWFDPRSAK
ncbi:DUF262 domain-containing protein [Parvularcula sp. ZS-1/3]|uniref:DUF262 domain-containing protein n=1 Tax=Parvularcula mediterranea TaxID=2732508 RepID=A0A7Y3RPA4_9PROT|nr:DUF262 domain-containing protein [Parvularcula mediterranea]